MAIVYKTTNTVNNKFYIGVHDTTTINSSRYLGSGSVLKRAIMKYGKDKFVRTTLIEFDTVEEAYDYEAWLVNDTMINRPDCYNAYTGGLGGRSGFKFSDETKLKMSEAKIGYTPWNKGVIDPTAKCNQPKEDKTANRIATQFKVGQESWNKGLTFTDEQKQKSSSTWFKPGNTPDEDTRQKISSGLSAYLQTDEGKKQRSEQMKKVWAQRKLNKLKETNQ